ncbi:pyruvate kinase [Candidatus Omnitrophota bacterium]
MMVKIISTISPKTKRLNGIDICRINLAFGSKNEIISLANKTKNMWGYPILLDLPIKREKKRTNNLSFQEMISLTKQINPDYVALSYVKSHEEMNEFRNYFIDSDIKVIAKIETAEAMKDLDKIITFSDIVMIDRGDLASALGIGKLSYAQKRIIRLCNKEGKKVIVATEFLLSMVEKSFPTKSEVVDISNAISDGADFIMLSEETAIGKYSQHAVDVIKKIIRELEDKYKILILSAGPSLAMGQLTSEYHTSLIDIGGITILEMQLKALEECGIPDENVFIATGKGHDIVFDYVNKKLKKTSINFVYNPWYASSNMLVTLWLAREYIRKGFLVVYGDVIFDTKILRKIIKNQKDIVLCVEKKLCDKEDEKICVRDDAMVLPHSYKNLPFPKHKNMPLNEAFGEFIGIAKFNRRGATILINEMDEMIRQNNLWAYLMEAFEHLTLRGHRLFIEEVDGLLWNDNDTINDLERTKEILKFIKKS